MSWAKKKVQKWLSEDTEEKIEYVNSPAKAYVGGNPYGSRLESSSMNFRVHKASGGYVIETSSYDPMSDRSGSKLHIITDEQDIGHELGKILTMEALRNG